MRKSVFVGIMMMTTVAWSNDSKQSVRKPDQASDVTHSFECSGQTLKGETIRISGITTIFYQLKDQLNLIIMKKGHGNPSRAVATTFLYDSSHLSADATKHKNIFAAVRTQEGEIIMNYAEGYKSNKLEVLDFDVEPHARYVAKSSTVKCSGLQKGSYQ